MLRGRAAANIQPLLLGGYPYMVVVALPFRVTAEVPGEIEDPVAGASKSLRSLDPARDG